jgi:hypothetical protein
MEYVVFPGLVLDPYRHHDGAAECGMLFLFSVLHTGLTQPLSRCCHSGTSTVSNFGRACNVIDYIKFVSTDAWNLVSGSGYMYLLSAECFPNVDVPIPSS